jgi:hypothetical protein
MHTLGEHQSSVICCFEARPEATALPRELLQRYVIAGIPNPVFMEHAIARVRQDLIHPATGVTSPANETVMRSDEVILWKEPSASVFDVPDAFSSATNTQSRAVGSVREGAPKSIGEPGDALFRAKR